VYERHGADTKVVDFNLLEGFMEDTFLAYGVEPSDAALCANVRASCSRLPHPVSSRFRRGELRRSLPSITREGTSVRKKFEELLCDGSSSCSIVGKRKKTPPF